jgi:hypothetical protein
MPFVDIEKIPPDVKIAPEEYEVEGHSISVVTCQPARGAMSFSHFTSIDRLKAILESGYLSPSREECSVSCGAVSFSVNPKHFYGAGNIKMTFFPFLKDRLVPMRYYDYRVEREKGFPFGEIEEKYLDMGIGSNEMATALGMTDGIYITECEWFSRSPIPLRDFLLSITYMIPWSIDELGWGGFPTTSCERSSPRYSRIETYKCDWDCLVGKINEVGSVVRGHEYVFNVDSCFPYVHDTLSYHDGKLPDIVLDEKNLQRLARGADVVRVSLDKAEAENMERECKC